MLATRKRFTDLGLKLSADANTQILLFGGPDDKEKCMAIAHAINSVGEKEWQLISVVNYLSLKSAVAMEACSLIVTNDTGLMHIACAMKKKVVGSSVQLSVSSVFSRLVHKVLSWNVTDCIADRVPTSA